MKESFKDTDLREALRREFSDMPQLPADFMAKMQERIDQQHEPSAPKTATKKMLWRWIAAAACLLTIIGFGVTMLSNDHDEQTKDTYAQTTNPYKAVETSESEKQQIGEEQTNNMQEETELPTAIAKAKQPVVAKVHKSSESSPTKEASSKGTSPATKTSPAAEASVSYRPTKDEHLHYASQSPTEDTTYQAPKRMDEFIAKIADYNKVKAVPLDCTSDRKGNSIVNTAYVFQDTQEIDLFGRLLQAACWYDSKTPGYLLNFSHQQFYFTLKDLRKGEKYLWIAERIDGNRILLFSSHSPIDATVSSICYQKYREQLTQIPISTLQF